MSHEEFSFVPAADLVRLIRHREVSPVELMRATVARMEALNAKRLLLTHFGPVHDPGYHLDQVLPEVNKFIDLGVDLFERGADQDRVRQALTARMAADLDSFDVEVFANYEMATPAYMAAMGIERYFRKRNG